MELSAPIDSIKYIGPRLARVLSKKGIHTVEDALYFLPRAYEDRRRLSPIQEPHPGQVATLLVTSSGGREIRVHGQTRFEASAGDHTGGIRFFWFRSFPTLKEDFGFGKQILVHGKVSFFGGIARITHPDYEVVKQKEGGPSHSLLPFWTRGSDLQRNGRLAPENHTAQSPGWP